MKHTFRWNAVLQALGIKGGDVPELEARWVPSLMIGSAAEQSNPMLGPQASFGGYVNAGVATQFGLVVAPLTDGGCVIEDASFFAASGANIVSYTLDTMPTHAIEAAGAFGTGATAQHMTGVQCRTIVRHGVHAVAAPADAPKLYLGTTNVRFAHPIWVPPGYCCGFTETFPNIDVYFTLKVRDIVEGVGPA